MTARGGPRNGDAEGRGQKRAVQPSMSRFAIGQTVYIVPCARVGKVVRVAGARCLVRYVEAGDERVREEWFADADLSATL